MKNTILFSTQKSKSEVTSILNRAIESESRNNQNSVRGRIKADKVYLYKHSSLISNAFRPVFVGELVNAENRTNIVGSFKIFWLGKIAGTVWFFGVGIIFSLVILDKILGDIRELGGVVVFATLFILGGILVIRSCGWLGRGDKKYIKLFVEKNLAAGS